MAAAPPVTEAPVVPSQYDPCSTNNNNSSSSSSITSSPESVALLCSSPLQLSFSTSMFPVDNNNLLTCDDIAQRIPLSDAPLPEFHQYSIESFMNSGSNKRSCSRKQIEEYETTVDKSELKRRVHIQAEQKRRAEIKEGFDVLRQYIPGCVNKKLSKATLLKRAVQQLQHLKKNQASILAELKKQAQENEMLKLSSRQ